MKSSNKTHSPSLRLEELGQSIKQMGIGERESYAEAVKRVACLLLVQRGAGPSSHASDVNAGLSIYYPEFSGRADLVIRSDFALWRITGGWKKLSILLAKGGIIPAGSLGKWSPDFLSGLSKSGVFRGSVKSHTKITSSMGNRPILCSSFKGEYGVLPFNCAVSSNASGRNLLALSSSWGLFAGADNPNGTNVLAGFLCGGRRVMFEGYSWLGVVANESSTSFLDSFSIPYLSKRLEGRKDTLLISPFWGSLLSVDMPEQFGDWFENWFQHRRMRPGMYPLLPWAFLRAVWGVGTCYTFPRNIVPFLTDRNTLREIYGIGMRDVRKEALLRFGFVRVDPRLREVWLRRLVAKGFTSDSFPIGKNPFDRV